MSTYIMNQMCDCELWTLKHVNFVIFDNMVRAKGEWKWAEQDGKENEKHY